jgi:transmembrane sensor
MTTDPNLIEAAEWLAELEMSDEVTAHTRGEFQQWLESDFRHREAYARVERNWRTLDRLPLLLRPPKYRSRQEVMAAIRDLHARTDRRRVARKRHHKITARIAGCAVAVTAAVAVTFFSSSWLEVQQPTHWTGYESADRPIPVRLEDGSLLYLNRNSHVRVHFTDSSRELSLDAGESFFRVSHEPRSFVVWVDKTSVRATGTEFRLKRHPQGMVEAAVKQGSVEIDSPQCTCDHKQLHLEAGHAATVTASEMRKSEQSASDTTHTFDWTNTLQIDETLAEAVTKFNWYNDKKLDIANPALERLKVAGFYDWSRPEAFAASLHEQGIGYRVLPSSEPGKSRIELFQIR